MFDPDVPKLRTMLKSLQQGVAEGAFTPEGANEVLGNYADSLVKKSNPNPWQRTVDNVKRGN